MISDEELDRIARAAAAREDTAGRRPNDHLWVAVRSARARRSMRLWVGLGAVAASLVLLATGVAMGRRLEHARQIETMSVESAQLLANHLQQSAAVIVAFRTAIEHGGSTRDLVPWARHLESVTRQMRATRTIRDSTLDGLLGDLDYVLAQIAAYNDARAGDATESALIESSLRGQDVEARLRIASEQAARRVAKQPAVAP